MRPIEGGAQQLAEQGSFVVSRRFDDGHVAPQGV
jgi:hypothetical protein